MTETTQIKTTNKITCPNPYEENTPAWHVFIDCSWMTHSVPFTINDLIRIHGQTLNYYQTYLGQLATDGVLTIEAI